MYVSFPISEDSLPLAMYLKTLNASMRGKDMVLTGFA
jgi:hypothetical protein